MFLSFAATGGLQLHLPSQLLLAPLELARNEGLVGMLKLPQPFGFTLFFDFAPASSLFTSNRCNSVIISVAFHLSALHLLILQLSLCLRLPALLSLASLLLLGLGCKCDQKRLFSLLLELLKDNSLALSLLSFVLFSTTLCLLFLLGEPRESLAIRLGQCEHLKLLVCEPLGRCLDLQCSETRFLGSIKGFTRKLEILHFGCEIRLGGCEC